VYPQPPQRLEDADPVVGVAAPSKSPDAREDAEEKRSEKMTAPKPENPDRAIFGEV